jgi:aryl-alcohol dehydrogenase-like predicted oxidoreductase
VIDERESLEVLARALELGVTCFDTANMYSAGRSERVLGRMLREAGARGRVIIATKLYFPVGDAESGLSARNVMTSCEDSLRRLGVETIDLLQIHCFDEKTPVVETMEALGRLVREGKVRHLGACNLSARQLVEMNDTAQANGWPEFETLQVHYNLLYREEERELLPLCVDREVAVLPWSPLARGRLARPSDPFATPRGTTDDVADALYGSPDDPVLDALARVSNELGIKPARVALAWLLSRPWVTTPIVGVTRLEHLEDALAAADTLLPEAMARQLEDAYGVRSHVELPNTVKNETVLDPID